MIELEVKIPAAGMQKYPIYIGAGLLGSVVSQVSEVFAGSKIFVVTDENVVAAGHLQSLCGDSEIANYVISPAGETSKHIDTVVSIVESMEKGKLGRDTVVCALGGGTVGDIAGFAASIFKRGVPVVQIPTTTLSQADSAVGGKTGVDSTLSKNAFGTFWQPRAVYVDVSTLKTLDERQYRAGIAEWVKHAVIADEQYFGFLEENLDAVLAGNEEILAKCAEYNCGIKAAVVEADPTEKNQRKMLNYGHTIGHAVEQVSGFDLLHGESIAIGMIGAGLIQKEMGIGGEGLERITKILERLSMPMKIPAGLEMEKIMEAIARDKKAVNGWPRFILVNKIGEVRVEDGQYGTEVSQDIVRKILKLLW